MRFQIRSRAPVLLEPITFADIVINLFVFFFISFGLLASLDVPQTGALPIQLPKGGQKAENVRDSGPLVIKVDRSKTIFLENKPVVIDHLKDAINLEFKHRKNKKLVVRADTTVQLGQFVPLLDVLRTTHARSVSVETDLSNR